MQCLKCCFHMDIHIDPVSAVTIAEHFSRWNSTSENIYKTITWFCWVPSGRYQEVGHLLQNLKFRWNAMGFNNHNLSHKTLKHRALRKICYVSISRPQCLNFLSQNMQKKKYILICFRTLGIISSQYISYMISNCLLLKVFFSSEILYHKFTRFECALFVAARYCWLEK